MDASFVMIMLMGHSVRSVFNGPTHPWLKTNIVSCLERMSSPSDRAGQTHHWEGTLKRLLCERHREVLLRFDYSL
jgi:hypothetical protein